jgi:hypothetical protein
MTARSGDALSHVNFQARPNAISIDLRAPEFRPARNSDPRPHREESVPVVFAWRP